MTYNQLDLLCSFINQKDSHLVFCCLCGQRQESFLSQRLHGLVFGYRLCLFQVGYLNY